MYRFAPNPNQLNIDGVYKSKKGSTQKINTIQNSIDGFIWLKNQDPTRDPPAIQYSGALFRGGALTALLRHGVWYYKGQRVNGDAEADFDFDEDEKKVKVVVRLYVPNDNRKIHSIWRATKIR